METARAPWAVPPKRSETASITNASGGRFGLLSQLPGLRCVLDRPGPTAEASEWCSSSVQSESPIPTRIALRKLVWTSTHIQLSAFQQNLVRTGGSGLRYQPGKYKLELTGTTTAKTAVTLRAASRSDAPNYPKIKVQLAVERKFTEPDPEQVKQIADANKIKEEHLNHVTPEREWDGNFAAARRGANLRRLRISAHLQRCCPTSALWSRLPRSHGHSSEGHE